MSPVLHSLRSSRSESRRKEVLAVYGLLFAMTDNPYLRIEHDDLSRPVIDGYHVSISHTRGYAALLLSTRHKVAIDIEFISNRVERVASKFIRNDEVADSLYAKLIHWSAKDNFCIRSILFAVFDNFHIRPIRFRIFFHAHPTIRSKHDNDNV